MRCFVSDLVPVWAWPMNIHINSDCRATFCFLRLCMVRKVIACPSVSPLRSYVQRERVYHCTLAFRNDKPGSRLRCALVACVTYRLVAIDSRASALRRVSCIQSLRMDFSRRFQSQEHLVDYGVDVFFACVECLKSLGYDYIDRAVVPALIRSQPARRR